MKLPKLSLKRSQLIGSTIVLGCIVFLGLIVLGFSSLRLIARHVALIENTLSAQQKSIDALNNIPGNQSSLANANPGFVTMDIPADPSAPVLGSANAPVTIIEFADFQCPFCEKFFQQSESDIINTYVNTGKARFIFMSFPFLGDESENAAEAAACAQDQGQFWPYHDYLYSHQASENSGALTIANLEKIAAAISSIKQTQFNECLSTHAKKASVQKNLATAISENISSTPTVLINGKAYIGLYTLADYEAGIDNALRDSR